MFTTAFGLIFGYAFVRGDRKRMRWSVPFWTFVSFIAGLDPYVESDLITVLNVVNFGCAIVLLMYYLKRYNTRPWTEKWPLLVPLGFLFMVFIYNAYVLI